MKHLNVDEAGDCLADLIRKASQGEEIVIEAEGGNAVRLVPIPVRGQPRFGSARGLFTMRDDFDAPLPEFSEYER